MSACNETDCDGNVDRSGYCDTCGTKATSATSAPPPVVTGSACAEPGCGGAIDSSGYCDTCGTRADTTATEGPGASTRSSTVAALATSMRTSAFAGGSTIASGSRRVTRDSTRTQASKRASIGGGLVTVPDAPAIDPATVVMAEPEVAEGKRYCGSCGEPVGRSKGTRAGRSSGFCGSCRTPYDFVPKLAAGDLVGGQYRVVGPIAHGGLGWIYLAQDEAVSKRWVVLKGLLNSGDAAAMAAAVAERRFLAQVQHPAIVQIYNFATHEGSGYTVMEYVGGPSLKAILKQRRKAAGEPDPLPVEHALAYMISAMPAFQYLHERGLVYCDFKPDNLIQVGDSIKLIDLGGVHRIDDPEGDIYGTIGFQAPEVPTMGVSVSSDLYTIGRTLAVLTMDFRGYTSTYVASLPEPADHPALADNEPFLRLLRKACAPHPDDRFQSVDELTEQMTGVLRILVSARTATPRPGPSTLFAGAPSGDDLPWLAIDPTDPAAAFLSRLDLDPELALRDIEEALANGSLSDTVEVQLRRATDLIEADRATEAGPILERILADDPWEWRAVWLQGYAAIESGDAESARSHFDRCRSEAPGELAPLFAAARAAEMAGDLPRAAGLYDLVSSVDPAWVTASLGLARTRSATGDQTRALAAYDRIPVTHRAHGRAQREAVAVLASSGKVTEAIQRARALGGSDSERAQTEADVLQAALAALGTGTVQPDPGVQVGDHPLTEPGIRRGLEDAFRRLARTTTDPRDRVALVDRANAVRPRTLL